MKFPITAISVRDIIAYLLAYASSFILFVVMLKLPYRMLKPKHLVDEFYKSGFSKNIGIECIAIFVYLFTTEFIAKMLNIHHFTEKIVISAIVTTLFTGILILYFTHQTRSNAFFSRFYKAVTWHAIPYDILFVFLVYYKFHHITSFLTE